MIELSFRSRSYFECNLTFSKVEAIEIGHCGNVAPVILEAKAVSLSCCYCCCCCRCCCRVWIPIAAFVLKIILQGYHLLIVVIFAWKTSTAVGNDQESSSIFRHRWSTSFQQSFRKWRRVGQGSTRRLARNPGRIFGIRNSGAGRLTAIFPTWKDFRDTWQEGGWASSRIPSESQTESVGGTWEQTDGWIHWNEITRCHPPQSIVYTNTGILKGSRKKNPIENLNKNRWVWCN